MTSAQTFTKAVLDVTGHGQTVPCEGPHGEAWVSESPSERRRAARICGDCLSSPNAPTPPTKPDESWGVWAGKDRTRKGRHG
jgi:hypothetical protein